MRQRHPIIAVIIAAAAVAGGLIYYFAGGEPSATLDHARVEGQSLTGRSAAYQFGFANAALSGCKFEPGNRLDELSAAIERHPQGIVPDDLKAGFADFERLQQVSGPADVCSLAEDLFGPRGYMRSGILQPR